MRCYACVALLLTLLTCACQGGAPRTRARAVRANRAHVVPSIPGGDGASPLDERSPVAIENELVGTDAYGLQHPAYSHELEGYASASSVGAGEELRVFINVDRAQSVGWELSASATTTGAAPVASTVVR
jgi:hypothetical protein